MTVFFMDSANGSDYTTKWDTNNLQSYQIAVTPSGGNAYRIANTSYYLTKNIPAGVTSLIYGGLWRVTSGSNGLNDRYNLRLGSNYGYHLCITVDENGKVILRRGTNTNGTWLAESNNAPITFNNWHYVEIRATLDDSAGVGQIWVDGVQAINFTGDTRNGGSDTEWSSVYHGRWDGIWDFAQIYLASATTPLGPVRPVLLYPSGNGNSSGMTGSDADQVDNYLLVDETTPNDDTDYVAASTEGTKDTYAMGDMPAGTYTIHGVQAVSYARKTDTGTKYIRPVVRTNSTDYVGSSAPLGESYDTHMYIWETNPNTASAWTKSEVDALEAGVEVRDS